MNDKRLTYTDYECEKGDERFMDNDHNKHTRRLIS